LSADAEVSWNWHVISCQKKLKKQSH